MKKVAWFDDAISFALAWNNIPHRDINNFFFDQDKGVFTAYNVNNVPEAPEKRFDGLSLFLDNVIPAWEDEVNAQGGEFRIDFKASSLELVQSFWETLIFDVVTSQFPETDMLAGVRLLDKSRGDQGSFRIEIWTKFDDSKSEMGQAQQAYLQKTFVEPIKTNDGYDLNIYKDGDDPISFKQHSSTGHSKDQKRSAPPKAQTPAPTEATEGK